MGGYFYDICGELAKKRLEPSEERLSFGARLLRRKGTTWPKLHESPNGWKRFEVLATDLEKRIVKDFKDYLDDRIKNPWKSTRAFKSYLEIGVQRIYVRGEQPPNEAEPKWNVQISFSDCAGNAGVLAELAGHWTSLWYEENRERINNELLIPWGFTSQPRADFPQMLFFPFDDLGYARYNEQPQGLEIGEDEVLAHFGPDGSTMEILVEKKNSNWLRDVEAKYSAVMADMKCRCQLCMPDFEPPTLPEI